MAKVIITVKLSEEQRDHADKFAQRGDKSLTCVIREALAQYTGYDLEEEKRNQVERRGRPRKYSTPEEAKEAARQRARDRYDIQRRLLDDHRAQQRQRDAQRIAESLIRRGVSLK